MKIINGFSKVKTTSKFRELLNCNIDLFVRGFDNKMYLSINNDIFDDTLTDNEINYYMEDFNYYYETTSKILY